MGQWLTFTDAMKLVFLLGVLSLLALSSTADTETSLTALKRGVRQARKGKQGKKKGGSKKGKGRKERKGRKGKKTSKGQRGNRKKLARGNRKKQAKGKTRKEKKNIEVKGKKKKANNRRKSKTEKAKKNRKIENRSTTPTPNCEIFYGNLKGYRFDSNNLRQLIRVNRTIIKLRNKVEKAATAFMDGAKFFKDCPEGQEIYKILRECNVTVPVFCNPDIFLEEYSQFMPLYRAIDDCKTNLTKSTEQGNNCTSFCPDPDDKKPCTCDYTKVQPNCKYTEFDTELKKFNKICFDANVQGTFSNCTSLLRDSYDTAITCCSARNSTTTPTTTTKNPAGALLKLRTFNDFKSWKLNL